MLTEDQIREANDYGEWLRLAIHECKLPSNDRVRASASCLSIAQDHHHAIVVLLEAQLYASCFALLRVVFEAFVRGEWLSLCAKDSEIKKFMKGKEPPKIDNLLKILEETDGFKNGALTILKKKTWRAMCSYTHTGGLHVQRWNTLDGIEPNYSLDELLEVLKFADIIVTLSVLGVITLMDDDDLAVELGKRFKKRMAT